MKKTTIILSALLFSLFLFAVVCLLSLPYLANTYIFPKVIKSLPFSEKEFRLSTLSPWKLRGTLAVSDSNQDILALPAIEFNFSPQSILNGRIDSILVDGGSLHLNFDRTVPKKNSQNPQSEEKQRAGITPFLMPVACNTLTIKNSTIILHQKLKAHHFTVNGTFTAEFKDHESGAKQFSSAKAKIDVTGGAVFSSTLDLQAKKWGHELLFTLFTSDISRITYLFPKLKKNNVKGLLSLSGRLGVEDLTRIKELQATAELSGFSAVLGNITLTNNSSSQPLTVTLKGDRKKMSSEIKNLFLDSPFNSSIELQGEFNLADEKFKGSGQAIPESIKTPVQFSFSGEKNISGTDLHFTTSTGSFSLGETSALLFSPFNLHGNVNINKGKLAGNINGAIAKIALVSHNAELNNLSFSVPVRFPQTSPNKASGTFNVDEIRYKKTPSGSLKGKIYLNSEGAEFSTLFASRFGPDIQVKCSGTFGMDGQNNLNCHLPVTAIHSASFPPFLRLPSEISIDGKLSAKASFSSFGRSGKGELQLQFNDGSVEISDNRLSSVNVAIVLPDLPLIQSNPDQLCTIGSIQFGNIKLSDAKIHFRLEDPQTIFIEKSRFAWCAGNVESGSFRLSNTKQELETTLYCDRLDFSQLLSQFGIDDTEGDGSLNGRLPVVLSKTGMKIDDGFLFSTPGNTGIVHFNNTAQLRQSIGNIDQTPYLDYSMEALKNFSYNWTKLTFNSQEEDLLIKMQIDGKPAKPLPFGYKKGHIIQSKKGPGLQHPIRLDINFRLPLTDLFQYGKNMQSFMENM